MSTPQKPLTFGDAFTLPATGGDVWTIHDRRPPFANAEGRGSAFTASAATQMGVPVAFFGPQLGWTAQPTGGSSAAEIITQLNALDVDLPARDADDWQSLYRRYLRLETVREVGEIADLIRRWTAGTDIDADALRAHVAAVVAVRLVSADWLDDSVYEPVYEAVLSALRTARGA